MPIAINTDKLYDTDSTDAAWVLEFNHLGVGACRLVGFDPDQLPLQAPFPEGLPAPMAGSPMARQFAPCGLVLRSCRTGCRPVSLLAQEAGGPQLRPQVALLLAGGPRKLVGFVLASSASGPLEGLSGMRLVHP
jgi:hypothetical protein